MSMYSLFLETLFLLQDLSLKSHQLIDQIQTSHYLDVLFSLSSPQLY